MRAEPLLPARVYRFYRGGALIGRLRDEPEEDGLPEDWIGSVTAAKNPGRDDPEEGLSRLADGRLLRQVVEADPNAWLGEEHVTRFGTSTGLLVKLLDAAERLPVHAHPDRPFAREAFDSPFGKTEAWIVLDTRDEEAEVWVGLREPVEPERYLEVDRRAGRRAAPGHAEQDGGAPRRCRLRAGRRAACDRGGTAHRRAPGAHRPLARLRVAWLPDPARGQPPGYRLGRRGARARPERARADACSAGRGALVLLVRPMLEPSGRFAIVLVVDGEGTIDGVFARPGAAFAVPAAVEDIRVEGDLEVLRCLAPDPRG